MRNVWMAVLALAVLGGAARGQTMALLGVASDEQKVPEVAVAAGPVTTGPVAPAPVAPPAPHWDRLPADVQSDLARLMRNQLDQAPRQGDNQPCLAACNLSGPAYQAWAALKLPKETWPAFYFEQMGADGRRIFLTLYVKLKTDGVWDLLESFDSFYPPGAWAGFQALPKNPAGFRDQLIGLGYGDWFKASRSPRWGVRSPNMGCQFHFIGPPPGSDPRFVEFHLDFQNPGSYKWYDGPGSLAAKAVAHIEVDLWSPTGERIADRLLAAVKDQGLTVPDVDESRVANFTLSNFLKWNTGSSPLGFLWLNPVDRTAGFWTKDGGNQYFDRVTYSPQSDPTKPLRFMLHAKKYFAEIYVQPDGDLTGQFYWTGNTDPVDLSGDLVDGHVYGP